MAFFTACTQNPQVYQLTQQMRGLYRSLADHPFADGLQNTNEFQVKQLQAQLFALTNELKRIMILSLTKDKINEEIPRVAERQMALRLELAIHVTNFPIDMARDPANQLFYYNRIAQLEFEMIYLFHYFILLSEKQNEYQQMAEAERFSTLLMPLTHEDFFPSDRVSASAMPTVSVTTPATVAATIEESELKEIAPESRSDEPAQPQIRGAKRKAPELGDTWHEVRNFIKLRKEASHQELLNELIDRLSKAKSTHERLQRRLNKKLDRQRAASATAVVNSSLQPEIKSPEAAPRYDRISVAERNEVIAAGMEFFMRHPAIVSGVNKLIHQQIEVIAATCVVPPPPPLSPVPAFVQQSTEFLGSDTDRNESIHSTPGAFEDMLGQDQVAPQVDCSAQMRAPDQLAPQQPWSPSMFFAPDDPFDKAPEISPKPPADTFADDSFGSVAVDDVTSENSYRR